MEKVENNKLVIFQFMEKSSSYNMLLKKGKEQLATGLDDQGFKRREIISSTRSVKYD